MADEMTMTTEKRSSGNRTQQWILRILRWLNYVLMTASLLSIAVMLALRLSPAPWGWAFISFSVLSFFSALAGFVLSFSFSSVCCYSAHASLAVSSASLQGAAFLFLLSKPALFLHHIQSSRSDYDASVLLKSDATLRVGIFCVQTIVLVSSCLLHYCEPAGGGYHDLEGKAAFGRKNMAKVQEIEEEEFDGKKEAEKEKKNVEEEKKDGKNEKDSSIADVHHLV